MFLDIAFGVFASKIVSNYFGDILTLSFLILGIIFVLLPDIDMLWYKYSKKINHRGFTHYPIVYIVLFLGLYFFINNKIALLFLVTTMFHFVHDTCILGWGVAWFAPISYRRFKVFPDNGKGGFLKESILTWLPDEQLELEKKLNDIHWIKNWYGKVTIVSVVEYISFFVACVYLIYIF